MKYLKNLCLSFLVMCCSILGITSVNAAELLENSITATGTASMEVAPDIAFVNFNVLGRGDTAEVAASLSAERVAHVKRALLGAGITTEDIETINYYVNPVYGEKSKINSYQASHYMKVKINDIDQVGSIIDRLTANGADSINNVDFGISNQEVLQRRLLGKALEDARLQSEVVANAAGRNLGKLLAAKINNCGGYSRMYNSVMLKGAAGSSSTVIETKGIKVNASVEASFEIK
ncbi:MAG: SIMPL domain-containing protein [Phascolarctobacterium sp.]|nr:SIMPL domain-containing protein [Phascolarctobacterium sp.]